MLFLYFFIANYTTYQKTTGYDFITIKQKIKDKKSSILKKYTRYANGNDHTDMTMKWHGMAVVA